MFGWFWSLLIANICQICDSVEDFQFVIFTRSVNSVSTVSGRARVGVYRWLVRLGPHRDCRIPRSECRLRDDEGLRKSARRRRGDGRNRPGCRQQCPRSGPRGKDVGHKQSSAIEKVKSNVGNWVGIFGIWKKNVEWGPTYSFRKELTLKPLEPRVCACIACSDKVAGGLRVKTWSFQMLI